MFVWGWHPIIIVIIIIIITDLYIFKHSLKVSPEKSISLLQGYKLCI